MGLAYGVVKRCVAALKVKQKKKANASRMLSAHKLARSERAGGISNQVSQSSFLSFGNEKSTNCIRQKHARSRLDRVAGAWHSLVRGKQVFCVVLTSWMRASMRPEFQYTSWSVRHP